MNRLEALQRLREVRAARAGRRARSADEAAREAECAVGEARDSLAALQNSRSEASAARTDGPQPVWRLLESLRVDEHYRSLERECRERVSERRAFSRQAAELAEQAAADAARSRRRQDAMGRIVERVLARTGVSDELES